MSSWLGITHPGMADQVPTVQPVESQDVQPPAGEPACLVVGFDHRPAAEAALLRAAELATLMHADLHVVHVVDVADAGPDPDAADWEDQVARCVEAERRRASELLADFPGHWTYQTHRGQPSRVLSNVANQKHAHMIVVGARRTGLLSTILGWFGHSVVSQLAGRSSRTPVLLVGPRR